MVDGSGFVRQVSELSINYQTKFVLVYFVQDVKINIYTSCYWNIKISRFFFYVLHKMVLAHWLVWPSCSGWQSVWSHKLQAVHVTGSLLLAWFTHSSSWENLIQTLMKRLYGCSDTHSLDNCHSSIVTPFPLWFSMISQSSNLPLTSSTLGLSFILTTELVNFNLCVNSFPQCFSHYYSSWRSCSISYRCHMLQFL